MNLRAVRRGQGGLAHVRGRVGGGRGWELGKGGGRLRSRLKPASVRTTGSSAGAGV
jgi:hypothetical protein